MKLISNVTEIYCIADDFCKEYELELSKKHFRFQALLPTYPKTRNGKGRVSDAEMITFLSWFKQNVSLFQPQSVIIF